MHPSDRMTNLRLKREISALAKDVSTACPGTLHTDYILHKDELDPMEISEQNESLTEPIQFLQARLQKLQPMPSDSLRRLLLLRCGLLRLLHPLLQGSNAGEKMNHEEPGADGCLLGRPFMIRSSSIQVRRVVSYRRESLSTCKYPEIFTRPSSGTS